jgi:hypothetical protein
MYLTYFCPTSPKYPSQILLVALSNQLVFLATQVQTWQKNAEYFSAEVNGSQEKSLQGPVGNDKGNDILSSCLWSPRMRDTVVEDFPNLSKDKNLQIQEAR